VPCPSAAEIYECRDTFVTDLDAAIARVMDLYDAPWERSEAADLTRIADMQLGSLCRLVARAAGILPEDAPTLDGLEAELRHAADAMNRGDDSLAAECADRARKLRLEAAD
jgi:hypothetical protein